MYAEFTDDLITGNEMIDSQHKELISKINDLLKSCEERSNQSGAARMLNFLADYTDYHFEGRGGTPGFHQLSWHQ